MTSRTFQIKYLLGFFFIIIFLVVSENIHYALFHTVAELFGILTAFGIFIIGWNTRNFSHNRYIVFIGISFFFWGTVMLFHTLAYKGVSLFPGFDSNLPTQLWIVSRIIISVSLLIAPFIIKRNINYTLVISIYSFITAGLIAICFSRHFPDCFVEGTGLTMFKKVLEAVTALIIFLSLIFLHRVKKEFHTVIYRYIRLSIFFNMLSGAFFIFYISVFDISNFMGHIFMIMATYFMFYSVLETGLNNPYKMIFHDLKKRETELSNAIKRFQALFSGGNDAVFVYELFEDNSVSDFVEVNEKACENLGYTKDELLGMNIQGIVMNAIDELIADTMCKLREKGFAVVESVHKRKDGTPVPVEVSVKVLELEANTYVISMARDITERKQAQEKLEAERSRLFKLLESLPAFIYLMNSDRKISFVNKYFRDHFKYKDGMLCHDAVHAKHEQCPACNILQVFETQSEESYDCRHENGNIYRVYGFPFEDIDKTPMVLVLGIDITDRVRAEEEKEELIRELKKALEEVKTLSGLLPICASCKNIRDDKGYWNRIEDYISTHSDTEFTHSICPECMKKLYPEVYDEMQQSDFKSE